MKHHDPDGLMAFDQFQIDPIRRVFFREGESIPLKSKAFDVLLALIERQGEIVSKEELLNAVWPGQFVEENNLTVHIVALRKALGETKGAHRYIITVPGKGYRFAGEIDSATNGDFVIESREISRIVVERGDSDTDRRAAGDQSGLPSHDTYRRWPYALILVPILAIGAAYLSGSDRLSKIGNAAAKRPVMRSFIASGGNPQRVSISADGKQLAYIARSRGKDSIWLGDIETNQSRQVTGESDRLHNSLTFSPDGRHVYFTARDSNHPKWTAMRVSVDGSYVSDLGAEASGDLTLSPDAKRFAYFGTTAFDQTEKLIVADSETGKSLQVLFDPGPELKAIGRGISWSSDGKMIAFGITDRSGNGCEVKTVDVTSGDTATIGKNVCKGPISLAWLSDSSGLIMSAPNDEVVAQNQIWLLTYPAGEKTQITDDPFHYTPLSMSVGRGDRAALLEMRENSSIYKGPFDSSSSSRVVRQGSLGNEGNVGVTEAPDGNILFVMRIGGRRSIWSMAPDGSNPKNLIPPDENSDESQISVSPDNRFIVFQSARSGSTKIWRANRDGSGLLQLTNGDGNSQPSLSPDGSHVYYTQQKAGESQIWRMSINGGETEQITEGRTSWPEVSPDGSLLACATLEAGAERDAIAIYRLSDRKRIGLFRPAKGSALFNRLRWSPDGRSIIYKDIVHGLWKQPIEGGDPSPVFTEDDLRIYHFDFTATGEIVHSSGNPERQIVLMESFR